MFRFAKRDVRFARDVWLRQVMCLRAWVVLAEHITSLCGSVAKHHFCRLRQIHHLRRWRKHHFTNVGLFVIIDLKIEIRSFSYVRVQITYAFNGLLRSNNKPRQRSEIKARIGHIKSNRTFGNFNRRKYPRSKLWIEKGDQPSLNDLSKYHSKYSMRPYYNEFKTWRNALESFVEWVNTKDLDLLISDESSKQGRHTTNRDINLRTRFLVMKRDNFKCCICGRSPATTPGLVLHIDYIVPWSKGGETVIDNLQTLCSDCNLGKSNLE